MFFYLYRIRFNCTQYYLGIKTMSLEQVVYRAKAKATGGRDGRATSSDGVLDVLPNLYGR